MCHYWRIRIDQSRPPFKYDFYYAYLCTGKPYSKAIIPLIAVQEGMLQKFFLHKVNQVIKITKEEYLEYMWE